MVVHEVVHIYIPVLPQLIFYGMGYLEIVAVVVRGIYPLVALVVGNAVEHFRVCPASVVPVDYLAHEPEIRSQGTGEGMYPFDEIVIEAVRSVKAYAVYAPVLYPHFNGVQEIFHHLVIAEIELYQVIAVVPALVPEAVVIGGIPAEVQVTEPAAVS